jgi:MinD superfamily P-loop ATPase
MIISVASGKGGTGKTTVSASLAKALNNCAYIDCDVEEPNGSLFLDPQITEELKANKLLPNIDYAKCDLCGKCITICEFNALILLKDEILIFDNMCHSCGACAYFCPRKAISEIEQSIGVIKKGNAGRIEFMEGILQVGEASPVPLIKRVKEELDDEKINIIDAPPGTACSMVETVQDSDYCILVTESTPYGLNDLKLAIKVVKSMNIPFGIVINKYDSAFSELDDFLFENGYEILMKIPYDNNIAKHYSEGKLPVEDPEYKEKFKTLFENIFKRINEPVNYEEES